MYRVLPSIISPWLEHPHEYDMIYRSICPQCSIQLDHLDPWDRALTINMFIHHQGPPTKLTPSFSIINRHERLFIINNIPHEPVHELDPSVVRPTIPVSVILTWKTTSFGNTPFMDNPFCWLPRIVSCCLLHACGEFNLFHVHACSTGSQEHQEHAALLHNISIVCNSRRTEKLNGVVATFFATRQGNGRAK